MRAPVYGGPNESSMTRGLSEDEVGLLNEVQQPWRSPLATCRTPSIVYHSKEYLLVPLTTLAQAMQRRESARAAAPRPAARCSHPGSRAHRAQHDVRTTGRRSPASTGIALSRYKNGAPPAWWDPGTPPAWWHLLMASSSTPLNNGTLPPLSESTSPSPLVAVHTKDAGSWTSAAGDTKTTSAGSLQVTHATRLIGGGRRSRPGTGAEARPATAPSGCISDELVSNQLSVLFSNEWFSSESPGLEKHPEDDVASQESLVQQLRDAVRAQVHATNVRHTVEVRSGNSTRAFLYYMLLWDVPLLCSCCLLLTHSSSHPNRTYARTFARTHPRTHEDNRDMVMDMAIGIPGRPSVLPRCKESSRAQQSVQWRSVNVGHSARAQQPACANQELSRGSPPVHPVHPSPFHR